VEHPNVREDAIAAVVDVALHARERPVSARKLAARHNLPPRHLEPVLQALVHEGIFHGIRGPRGGYALTLALAFASLTFAGKARNPAFVAYGYGAQLIEAVPDLDLLVLGSTRLPDRPASTAAHSAP